MSAYLVDPKTIGRMAAYLAASPCAFEIGNVLQKHGVPGACGYSGTSTAAKIATALAIANAKSVRHHYSNASFADISTYGNFTEYRQACAVESAGVANSFRPEDYAATTMCYEYQACEHPDWSESLAKELCGLLKDTCLETICRRAQGARRLITRREQAAA